MITKDKSTIRNLFFIFIIVPLVVACEFSKEENNAIKSDEQAQGLPYYHTPDFTPQWFAKNDARLDTIHNLAAFSFRNQNNEVITEKDVAGKIHVANFFFTICPSLCPRLMKSMADVHAAFKNDANILLMSYSVTPTRDSVSVLRKYADVHDIPDGKWNLLTGDKTAIYTLARKSYFADENLGIQKGENDFLHTENFLLIDKKRRIRGIYNGTLPLDIDNLIKDIKVLEGE